VPPTIEGCYPSSGPQVTMTAASEKDWEVQANFPGKSLSF